MRTFSIRGNTGTSPCELFWDDHASALEFENCSDTHYRRHDGTNEEEINNNDFVSGITSISQLVKDTVEMIEKDGKLEGQYFKVSSECWVSLQLFPNNEHAATAVYYAGRFRFTIKLMRCVARDFSHPADHLNANIKKNHIYHANNVCKILCEYYHLEATDEERIPCVSPKAATLIA